MLVLSRKVGEKIVINDNITLIVVAIRGNCVRLGIEAPDDVHVMRSELLDRASVSPRWIVPSTRKETELAPSH